MSKSVLAVLFCLLFVFSVCVVSADDRSMAFLLAPPGAMLARAYTPSLPADVEVPPPEEASATVLEDAEYGPIEFQMKFGDSSFLKSVSYKRFPAVSDYSELTGYRARRDYYRSGTIETRSPAANKVVDFVADFFAGSPLIMEPQYFVHLSELYGEPLPQW